MAVLDLRDVRGADLDAVCELLLRKPCPITQCTQSVTKGHVITGGRVGGLDDLVTFTDRLGYGSLDRPYKWRPRCVNTRAPGTRSANSRHAGHATNPRCMAALPEPFSRSLQPQEEPTMSSILMIPPVVVPRVREGAVALLTSLGEELSDATWYLEQCEPLYKQVQEQWALLDVIGWADEDDTGEMVEAEIASIGKPLKVAVEEMTPSLKQWLGEMDKDDPARPARADELRLMQQFQVQVRRATQGRRGR